MIYYPTFATTEHTHADQHDIYFWKERIMESFIIFIMQSVGSGVIGHYLSKQLAKIDRELPALFESGNKVEIIDYVERKGISDEVAHLASDTLKRSFIIPPMPEKGATLADRVELFANVLRFGFEYSHAMQIDLLLPGSLLGPKFFTFFSLNSDAIPKIDRTDVHLKIISTSRPKNTLYILPLSVKTNEDALLEQYMSAALDYKANYGTESYFRVAPEKLLSGGDRLSVEALTAVNCVFTHGIIVKESIQKQLGIDGKSGKARIGDWNEGIIQMLNYASTLPNLGDLPMNEVENIKQIYKKLDGLYQNSLNKE